MEGAAVAAPMRQSLLALLGVAILAAGCTQSPASHATTSLPPAPAAVAQAVRHVAGRNDTALAADGVRELLQATGHDGGEPTIGVDDAGHLYVTAATFKPDPLVAPAGMPRTDILRSDDGGATWADVSPLAAGQKTHPFTGDPLLYLDTDTSRLFDLDQIDVACDYISSTDDHGATWTPPTDACPVPVSDHMTMVTAKPTLLPVSPLYPKSIYFCSNQLADAQCGRSLDGGNTFQTTTPPFSAAPTGSTDQQLNCGALVGHLKAARDGTVYLPNACDRPVLAITHDGMLSWTLVAVSPERTEPGPDPAVAVAPDGALYYTYL
ncbi:MAG: hypothetical protein QOI63_171, partial [Thermoplasmata archaeon]|nr:hypothetical protein [Thermoplasmata archaeon]